MKNTPSKFLGSIIKNGTNGNHILANVPQGEIKDSFVRPAVIICEKIHGQSLVYNLPNNKEFVIGQNPENDLCLTGDDVSGVHAKIRPEKDNYMLYDLASKSGLTVNWEKTLKCKLEHKNRIKIGSHTLIFEFVKEEEIFDGVERRKTNRVVAPMTLKLLANVNNKLEEVSGIVKDINLSGARIEIQKEVLRKGDNIEAGISSPELPLVEVIAQVIWERVQDKDGKLLYDIGLQFLEMDEKSRSRLKNYLNKITS
jgi:pSer/pThr/pTyr-binding forkhead associated (FHA) protein